jgi:flagellar basal body rod protein FlgC
MLMRHLIRLATLLVVFVVASGGCAGSPAQPALVLANDPIAQDLREYLTDTRVATPGHLPGSVCVAEPSLARRALLQYLLVVTKRIEITCTNIANAQTQLDSQLRNIPYRRKVVQWDEAGNPITQTAASEVRLEYAPDSPNADANGFVRSPDISQAVEAAELQDALSQCAFAVKLLRELEDNTIPSGMGK